MNPDQTAVNNFGAKYGSELQTEIIRVIEDSTYDHETHFTTEPPFSDILEKGICCAPTESIPDHTFTLQNHL